MILSTAFLNSNWVHFQWTQECSEFEYEQYQKAAKFGISKGQIARLLSTPLVDRFNRRRLQVNWVDLEVGQGIFTTTEFLRGEFIGEYLGKLITLDEVADDVSLFGYPPLGLPEPPCFIDATDSSSLTRLINHSTAENVCYIYCWDKRPRLWRVFFFASRLIARGDQLLYNYGPQYRWSNPPKLLR